MKKECPYCKGKGKKKELVGFELYSFLELQCSVCKGKGYIEVPDDSCKKDNGTADNKDEHS